MINVKLSGNIIPIDWYRSIKTEAGRTDMIAINILADVIYWYRPVEVRNEITGQLMGYRQKFKKDKLQKTYNSYAKMFDVSKRSIERSIKNLERLGLIKKEFRNIRTEDGLILNNVMFIEPDVENVFNLGQNVIECQNDMEVTTKCHSPSDILGGTNTDTTTKITTKTYIYIDDQETISPKQTQEPPQSKPQLSRKLMEILDHWNNSNIVNHTETSILNNLKPKHHKIIQSLETNKIKEAITLYSKVLHSKQHFFSYKWTLLEFITRGYDKFSPEASISPLEKFKINKQANNGPPKNFRHENRFLDTLPAEILDMIVKKQDKIELNIEDQIKYLGNTV